MQKVVHASLHGNAFTIEEAGYEALRAYLDRAAAQLAADPDRDEILGDLEQAIADKCARHLGAAQVGGDRRRDGAGARGDGAGRDPGRGRP